MSNNNALNIFLEFVGETILAMFVGWALINWLIQPLEITTGIITVVWFVIFFTIVSLIGGIFEGLGVLPSTKATSFGYDLVCSCLAPAAAGIVAPASIVMAGSIMAVPIIMIKLMNWRIKPQ